MPSSRITGSSSRGPSTPSRPSRSRTAPWSASKVNGVTRGAEELEIDPALLEETGGPVLVEEDAEGEVEEEEDAEGEYEEEDPVGEGVEEPYINYEELQYDQLPSQSSRPNSRSQRIPRAFSSQAMNYTEYPPLDDTPVPRRGRPPKNASLPTSRSAPRLNDHATPSKGKGKGKAVPSGAKLSGKGGRVGVDIHCSFCLGTNDVNRLGKPELMLSCARCGRSGHPTCLNIISKRLLKTVREYEWCCIECKRCEICEIKGDDNRLMFCDGCDRGWHSYCLNPPLVKPPKGQWLCPKCNPSAYNHSGPSLPSSRSAPNLSYKGKGRADHTPHSHSTPTARHKTAVLDPLINGTGPRKPKPHIATGRPRGRPRRDATLETDNALKGNVKIRLRIPSGRRTVEVESEEEKVPYGGIITGHDADTTHTGIKEADKAAFEKSRMTAEAKLGGPVDTPPGSPAPSNGSYFPSGLQSQGSKNGNGLNGLGNGHTPSKSTPLANRSLRDRILQQSFASLPGSPAETPTPGTPINLPNLSSSQKIKMVRVGVYEIDTWFSAPYPEEYQTVPDGRLWICEFCFKYMKSGFVAERHRLKCKARHPPGDEIYRDNAVSVFEVDGRKNKIYCQNLCLFAKMFLDSKTLYYDVEPFLFYVMTEVDDMGARFVGYFSKEKRSLDNNVSCIMTLPVRQRKGWGQLLIDFSYLLSKKEERVGGPERPLSGLGEVTYKKYWSLSVMRYLRDCTIKPTLEDISADTSMTLEDVFLTLKYENMVTIFDTPPRETPAPPPTYSRPRGRSRRGGRSLTNRRAPRPDSSTPAESEEKDKVVIPSRYEIVWDAEYIEAVLRKSESRGFLSLRPERLKYHPFLVSRTVQKPPGALARATLMHNNPNARRESRGMPNGAPNGRTVHADKEDSGTPVDSPEKVLSGEDQATLDLVARLSGGSRNLRHRTTSVTFDADEPASKRLRKNRSSTSLRRMASNEEEDEIQDEENEEEDDPLRLGKGMNGTPRRSKRVRPRSPSPVPVRATRSSDKLKSIGPNGLPNGEHAVGGGVDADGDVDMDGPETREETEEVEEPVEDVVGDEDAEGEEDEEWVE